MSMPDECPKCGAIAGIKSTDNEHYCDNCGYTECKHGIPIDRTCWDCHDCMRDQDCTHME